MKIALLSVPNPEKTRGVFEHIIRKMYPPLGLFYLEAYSKKYFSENLEFIITDNIDDLELKKNNPPHIIGISSGTKNFSHALTEIRKIKTIAGNEISLILGGPHISALPYSLPCEVNVGVMGEGEITFTELLKIYSKHGSFPEEYLKDLSGIVYHGTDGQIRINPPQNLIEDLDTIPVPDRRGEKGKTMGHLITSRGCKFNCYFCSTPSVWGKYRAHSPGYVVNELKILADILKEGHIIFFDDLFICDKIRLKETGERIVSEGLNRNFTFFAYGRTEIFDEEIAELLKKMNVTEVSLGTQRGFNKIAPVSFKEGLPFHQRAVDLCETYGIKLACSFIIGRPYEREEDLKDLCTFIEKDRNKMSSLQISPLRAFPASPLWDYAKEMGPVSDDMDDWSLIEDFTLFADFDPDNYMYLNKSMPFEVFKEYCREIRSLLSARQRK